MKEHIDHSQFGEGALLWEAVGRVYTGTFIDIGSNNGEKGSNVYGLWELGWRGIMVEADPRTFAHLAERVTERCILIRAAATGRRGWAPFYSQDFEDSGLSTLNKCASEIQCQELKRSRTVFDSGLVTLDSLLAMVDVCDLLSVDAETFDHEILGACSFASKPRVLCYEHGNEDRSFDRLHGLGYRLFGRTEANTILILE